MSHGDDPGSRGSPEEKRAKTETYLQMIICRNALVFAVA